MPLFEYICDDCDKQFTFLSGVVAENHEPQCPRCQSHHLRKLISRVSRGRTDDDRMDSIGERLDAQDIDDPQQLRRLAREMGREISAESGEDMTDEIEQLIDEESTTSSGGNSHQRDDDNIY